MVNKKLRVLLLSTTFLAMSLWKVKAFDWLPVGDSVSADGYALTGGEYEGGDRIVNTGQPGEEKSFVRVGKNLHKSQNQILNSLGLKAPYVFGNQYRGGEVEVPPAFNTQFEATAEDSVLNVSGTLNADPNAEQVALKVDGDVTLIAHEADMTVNVNTDVTFVSYVDPTAGSFPGTGFSQIYFDTAAGKKITVNVDHNLEFKGFTVGAPRTRGNNHNEKLVINNASRGGEGPVTPIDMILTFAGTGQVIFSMADGMSIKFTGDIDATNSVDVLDGNSFTGFSNNAAGTKVFITMEQTEAELNSGLNKVVFQRQSVGTRGDLKEQKKKKNKRNKQVTRGGGSTDSSLRDMILVGPNSIITFVSTDATGLAHVADATVGNFGSVAFDPSNLGTGRMVLFILGAYTFGFEEGFIPGDPEFDQISRKFPFNEGSVVIAGHHVAAFDPESIRTTLNYSVPAGGRAAFRVVDNQFFAARDTAVPFAPDPANRSGLLVINDNQSVSKRAADPYLDFFNGRSGGEEERSRGARAHRKMKQALTRSCAVPCAAPCPTAPACEEGGPAEIFGQFWSYSFGLDLPDGNTRNVRNGFVLGVNGEVEVYPNTFFDYVAGSVNQVDLLAQNDYQCTKNVNGDGIDALSVIKQKNPAAFIADGLDNTLFLQGLSAFDAANSAKVAQPVHARMTLRGDGAALFRASGSSKVGYITNFWKLLEPVIGEEEGGEVPPVTNPLDIPTLDFTEALLLGDGTFDGYRLMNKNNEDVLQKGEGNHVMEVEGFFEVASFANNSIIDPLTGLPRNYATVLANAGVVNMPTIEIDGRGNEVNARPIALNQTVRRYNSPAMFFNNHAAFMNTIVRHSDLTKWVDGNPGNSDPAITGGERFFFADTLFTFAAGTSDRDRYRFPEIQLFNASLEVQGSLNASGVRFVAKDIPPALAAASSGQAGNNTSVIRFFDNGDAIDSNFRGFGRIFQLGSYNNQMADGSTNYVTQSAYVNIFKHNQPSTVEGDASAAATLAFRTGDQFPADVLPADFDNQRAHQLFLMSGMNQGTTNMALGWSSILGNSGDTFPYDNTTLVNRDIAEPAGDPVNDFTVDAFVVPPATLSFEGFFVSLGGFECSGKSVRGPITRNDNQGMVYVRHGGKITVGDSASIPFQAVIDTIIAQKIRNDYNDNGNARVRQLTGIIDLPHDQSTFMPGAAVQTYGFTQEMFAERAAETSNFVRLSVDNPGRSKADRSGANVMEISWFNREGDNQLFNPQTLAAQSVPSKKARKTRATESITAATTKPNNLLYIGSDDDVAQLAVAGATQSDPFVFDVSGDIVNPTFGRVREFVTIPRVLDMPIDHMPGEGPHADIYVELGGRAGLGTRHFNERSVNAWSILGKDFVRVFALGDGVIDVNSNLLIADKQAIIATTEFANFGEDQRLTFFAENEYEIRIPSGGELDFSSFGHATNLQTVAFAGKAKLVVETGATIRFPTPPADGEGGFALLFTDDAQLIFEGAINPEVFTTAFADSAAANVERIKLIGNGQIRGNKNAKIQVLGSVLVGVQSDTQTPVTNLSISLQRDSQFNIGDSTLAGGAFEVGNPATVPGGLVNFTLQNFRGNPIIHIDREGFLGLGAGVINKHDNPNGNADRAQNPVLDAAGLAVLDAAGFPTFTPDNSLTTGWQVAPLFDVGNISVILNSGSFEHNNIVDGSDGAASLIAVGPATSYNFNLSGPTDVAVRGGGNVMFVPAGAGVVRANVWDFASPLPDGTQYSMLPSGPLLLDRGTSTDLNAPGFGTNGYSFAFTAQADFFNLFAFKPTNTQSSLKVDVGHGGLGSGALVVGFTNANVNAGDIYPITTNKIVRLDNPGVGGGTLDQGLEVGALIARGDGAIDPTTFGLIQ